MTERTAPIGIIGAMDVEVELLRREMAGEGDVTTEDVAGMQFACGTLAGTPVVVVKCGVGMVNAAICANTLTQHFGAAAVINTGIAGSLDASIDIGNVVVATDAVNHIMDVRNLGYDEGQTPGFDVIAFPADERLQQAVIAAAQRTGVTAHCGRVASGDHFVCSDEEKARITGAFGASCCEMEGAAIAQACWLACVPFAIVRAISDKADGSSSMDYPTFEAQAADHCAKLIQETLKELS